MMTEGRQRRIHFLGTGANDWLGPHECSDTCRERCARAAALGGRNIRRVSSLLIEPDILIDFTGSTAQALEALRGPSQSVRHLLVTHGHADHFHPLEILRLAAGLPHALNVYGNTMVKDALEFCARGAAGAAEETPALRPGEGIRIHVLKPGMQSVVGSVRATAVLANHMIDRRYMILEQQALNFVIEAGGKSLFYGLDSSSVLPQTLQALSAWQFDIAVLDATFAFHPIDPNRSGHQNFEMLDSTVAQFRETGLLRKDSIVVASHMSRSYVDPHDEIAPGLAARGITLAYDGMTLAL